MSKQQPLLRPDLHRAQTKLDDLPKGAVVVDEHGAAWQFGGIYWYRAFDSDQPASSFELAQVIGSFRVVEGGAA